MLTTRIYQFKFFGEGLFELSCGSGGMSKKSRLAVPAGGGSDQDEAVLDTLGKDLDARGGEYSK